MSQATMVSAVMPLAKGVHIRPGTLGLVVIIVVAILVVMLIWFAARNRNRRDRA